MLPQIAVGHHHIVDGVHRLHRRDDARPGQSWLILRRDKLNVFDAVAQVRIDSQRGLQRVECDAVGLVADGVDCHRQATLGSAPGDLVQILRV